MKARLATAIATLDRLVNYFSPRDIAADRDARNRAHVFLVSHILGPFIGSVVPISIFVLDPYPGYDVAVLAASILALPPASTAVNEARRTVAITQGAAGASTVRMALPA